MKDKFIAKATATIHTPVSKVWQALVNPDIIKQYLFDTDVISDWKVGSPITYKGNGRESPSKTKARYSRLSLKNY